MRTTMPVTLPPDIAAFRAELVRQDLARNTRESYLNDLALFARWFEQTNGSAFAAAAVTPTDVREYRGFLTTAEQRSPATVNRRLAALRKFFPWANGAGRVRDLPTEDV